MSFNEGFSTQGIPIVTASDGQVLTWSSAQAAWIAADASGPGFTGVTLDPVNPNLEGAGTVANPLKVKDDIDITSVTANKFVISGSLYTQIETKIANYSLNSSDDYVVVFNGSNLTASLPESSGLKGLTLIIKNIHNTPLFISSSVANTIDGESSATINKQYNSYTFVSDGTNWLII